MRRLFALLALVLAATVTSAQTNDHLKCYKVKDPHAKTSYTADLDGLIAEPGCIVKFPAKLVCVPAVKTNVQPAPPGGGPSGTPNFFVCYQVKCPRNALPPVDLMDQFGQRTFIPTGAKMLCAPATPTTTTTTTTLIPACLVGDAGGCGSCGNGACVRHCGSPDIGYCATPGPDSCLAPSGCQGDSDCPGGKICVSFAGTMTACAYAVCCDPCY